MSELTPPASDGVVQRILKNMALLFGGRTAAAIIGLLVLALAARAIDKEELGALLLLHAYVSLMSGIASFKSWQSLIHFGAEPAENGDTPRFHRLLRFTIGLDLVSGLFAAILSAGLFVFVRSFMGIPDEFFGFGLLYCFLNATNLRSTPLGVLRLHDRFDLISLHDQAIPLVRLIGCIIGLSIGAGLGWFILVWFAATATSHFVITVMALRELSRRGEFSGLFSRPPTLRAPETGIWRFVWMSNLDATIDLSDKHMPVMLSGFLLGPGFSAMFKIARDVSSILTKGSRLLNHVLYPELVKLMLAGSSQRALKIILRTSIFLLIGGLILSAIIGFFGPGFFGKALGREYEGTAQIATLLIIAAALLAATAPLFPGLYALGEPGRASLARAITVSITLSLFVILSRSMGEMGPGWAMIIGQAIGLGITAYIAISRLQLRRDSDDQAARNVSTSAPTNSGSVDPPERSG